MFSALVLVLAIAAQAGSPKAASVPSTPQGRQVEAFLKAFNSGDEKAYLAASDKLMAPELLAKRPPEERAKMFQRLRGDFGTLRIARVVKSTPAQIAFTAPLKDGNEGTFTFDFQPEAPFKISRLAVEVEAK
jgi:hypothetical protein